ncbi:MAG TPA: DUF3488 and transglutaminase-like domain-containing protein [Bryobacteraceae bacterium]|nr:DUF3488 and transglutaminase-like domain-containing protein [Bryobacteraceae bacterium]
MPGQASSRIEQYFQLSLWGLLASGFLALAGTGSLELPTLALTGAGLLLRLLMITGRVHLRIDPLWTTVYTLTYIGFYPLDVLYVSREFVPATVRLVCFLGVIRPLTAITDRDYFFIKVIAFLELLAATLLSEDLNFFVFLTTFLLCGVATLCCSEIRRSAVSGTRRMIMPRARISPRLAALTAGVTAGIVVLTAGLFFLLPRTARAAFRSLVHERYHLPGFSSEITLGQIGQLKTQTTPVMHAKIEAPDDRMQLKWRGSALSQFDGVRWYNPPGTFERIRLPDGAVIVAPDQQRRRAGPRISYSVRLGNVHTDTLFFAGVPELLRIDGLPSLLRGPGETYRIGAHMADGREYQAIGHLPERAKGEPEPLSEITRNEHLLLPASTDRRILELAREIGGSRSPEVQARAIEQHLRTRYSYTTDLLPEKVADPMAHFLFDRRQGHCEYFASAMAVMLRAVYVPSRVATGFQSGQYNPMTGLHVIRASDAHSWVEAWLPGRGWTTFDPTPPSGQPSAAAAMWTHWLLYLDAAETFWRQWVVDYNIERQIDVVAGIDRRTRNWNSGVSLERLRDAVLDAGKHILPIAGAILAVALLGLALYPAARRAWPHILHRRHSARIAGRGAVPSDAALLYLRMLTVLEQRGVVKPGWLTPGEFARALPETPDAQLVIEITRAYHDLRYAGTSSAGSRMLRLLAELEARR